MFQQKLFYVIFDFAVRILMGSIHCLVMTWIFVKRLRKTEQIQAKLFNFSVEYRNCFMVNAAELLAMVPDAANTKVSGTLIGSIIDTSVGEITFQAAGQDTGVRFMVISLSRWSLNRINFTIGSIFDHYGLIWIYFVSLLIGFGSNRTNVQ